MLDVVAPSDDTDTDTDTDNHTDNHTDKHTDDITPSTTTTLAPPPPPPPPPPPFTSNPSDDLKATGYRCPSFPGPVLQNDDLREKGVTEWIPGNGGGLESRILSFQRWLAARDEERIVVVGHSQWFKKMLGRTEKFGNCDVWRARFEVRRREGGEQEKEKEEYKWEDLEKLYEFDWEGEEEEKPGEEEMK